MDEKQILIRILDEIKALRFLLEGKDKKDPLIDYLVDDIEKAYKNLAFFVGDTCSTVQKSSAVIPSVQKT